MELGQISRHLGTVARKLHNMDGESSRHNKRGSILQDLNLEPMSVPLDYLKRITKNFSGARQLGEGGFGKVYKGVLENGSTIAVKKLKSAIDKRQFENEAHHLMGLNHPNIVQLLGYCSETETIPTMYHGKIVNAERSENLLCLEYLPNGCLPSHLSGESTGLDWDIRYKIIKGICNGLCYLHEKWLTPIIHMDLKPANILLDDNMVPKIADFGLSRLFGKEKTRTYTRSCNGTLGYMAPEYINRGIISKQLDIFSLGVIIIEIVTGCKDYPDEGETLSQEYMKLILNNWRNRMYEAPREFACYQIKRCIEIALDCVKLERTKRPTIGKIVEMLPGETLVDELKKGAYAALDVLPEDHVMIDNCHSPIHVDTYADVGAGPLYMSTATQQNFYGRISAHQVGVPAANESLSQAQTPSCANVNNGPDASSYLSDRPSIHNFDAGCVPAGQGFNHGPESPCSIANNSSGPSSYISNHLSIHNDDAGGVPAGQGFNHGPMESPCSIENNGPGPSFFSPGHLRTDNYHDEWCRIPGQEQSSSAFPNILCCQDPYGLLNPSNRTTAELDGHEYDEHGHLPQPATINCAAPGLDQSLFLLLCNGTVQASTSAHNLMTLAPQQPTTYGAPGSAQGNVQSQMQAPLPSNGTSWTSTSAQQPLPGQQYSQCPANMPGNGSL